ncbi:MAG: hypothetical protein VX877_06690, partial [Planctomycetota bacterium]|nr:hypothetical protein [Planctomycetota bacterium]
MKWLLTTLTLVLSLIGLSGCTESSDPAPAVDSSTGGGLLKVETKEEAAGNYIVLGTLTDQFDRAQAKANVEDTLARHSDISAMVG